MLRKLGDFGVVFYHSPLLARVGVAHGFSTRIGGISNGPFDSMNLGNPQGAAVQDEQSNIRENYRRLQYSLGMGEKPRCWVHQVHAGDVVFVRKTMDFSSGAKADAIISDDAERVISVRIADCGPILLATDDGAIVAAVHAGWRGVVSQVLPNTIREIRRMSGAKLIAAVGPCIGGCAFEVGPEVVEQFRQLFGADAPVEMKKDVEGKGLLDLRRAIELQLLGCGVGEDRIDLTDRCTHRDADEFFSHRREKGITGRMAALICARGNGSVAA